MKGPIMPVTYDDDGGVITRPKNEEKLQEPRDYMVVLLNDNYTTKEFVVHVLMLVFHKDPVEANRIMMNVHRKGRGIVGIYSYDIALTRANQVHTIAKEYEFPLRCIVEEV
jgi:ATP-dependent Clp protease adaptor protein ClpS